MTYESTGDPIFSFQDPILLSEYIPHNDKQEKYGKKGSMDVPMTPEQLKLIKEYRDDARIITDAVLEYIAPLHEQSTKELIDGLFNHYDGKIDLERLRLIFFHGMTEWTNPVTRKKESIFKGLDEDTIKEIGIVQDTFATTINDELIIANGGSIQEATPDHRQNYWPTIYPIDPLKFELAAARDRYITIRDGLEEQLEYYRQKDFENGTLKTPDDFLKANELLNKAKEMIESYDTVLDNMDLYNVDVIDDANTYSTDNNGLIHLAKDNKHFKHISNAYDIRSSRTDDGVFYDYLKHSMSAIERNNLAISLLDVLKKLKNDRNSKNPKVSDEEATAIIEAAVNLHRTTYNSVKTAGLWGHTIEGVTNKINGNFINKTFNIKTHPEYISRANRRWGSRSSGLLLQSPMSVITNVTGLMEQVLVSGLREVTDAVKMYFGKGEFGRYSEGIEKIIQQSGITEFSDFFSKSMVSGIVEAQLEEDIAGAILQEQLKYHNRIKRGMKPFESREIFNERIVKYLSASKAWLKAEDLVIRSKGRIKASLKELRSRERLNAANKLVNYAINKTTEFKKPLTNPLWKRALLLPPMKMFQFIGWLARSTGMTMSNGEAFIRSVSFIIGAQHAWEAGAIRNDIHWSQYTEAEDIQAVIDIGREMSYRANFGMSTQDVGAINRALGQLPMKFKYWPQQKWETDRNRFTEFIHSNRDTRDSKKRKFQLKPILKLFTVLNKKGMTAKELRTIDPSKANLRTFLLTQGIWTIVSDLLFWDPIKIHRQLGGKQIARAVRKMKGFEWMTGYTQLRNMMYSDYIHTYTLPFTIALRIALAKNWIYGLFGGDDEEDVERTMSYHLRRYPFYGFGVGIAYSSIWAVIAFANKERKLFQKKVRDAATIVYGRPWVGGPSPGTGTTMDRIPIPGTGKGFLGLKDAKNLNQVVEEFARLVYYTFK